MIDTQEEMYVEENDGYATLEIFNEEGDTVWHNGTDEHYYKF
jgi:hypothetical protein